MMEKLNKTFVKGAVLKAEELNSMVDKTNEIIDALDEKIGATYFDSATSRQLQFRTAEDRDAWIAGGSDSLIMRIDNFSFSGTIYQIKITDDYGTKQLHFTNVSPTALITVGFLSQSKGLTDQEWTEVYEDFTANVEVDRGAKGNYIEIISNEAVSNGDTLTFDVKRYLASGNNRVRITARGRTTNESATVVYNANLTSMYLSPANFQWHKPFFEGETYALGGMNIGGNLSKKVKVRITNDSGFYAEYEDNIGSATYITSTYNFRKLGFPRTGTGTYQVEIWLDADGLESDHLIYNIMCIAQSEKNTAQAICINEIANAVNGVDSELFKYAVYNKGMASASPTIRIEKDGMKWREETLADVPTSSPQSYATSLEFNDENPFFFIQATGRLGSAIQYAEIRVDNAASYPAVDGASFYLNAVSRSNAQENKEAIVNEVNGSEYTAKWTNMAWVDGTDGWTVDSDGRKCLLIPASCKGEINFKPLSAYGAGITIVLCYRVKAAADYNENIITIATNPTASDFQGIQIKPKKITVHSRDLKDDDKQSYPLQDEELVYAVVTIVKNYKTNYGNLCQVYVNGGKRCSFEFSSTDSFVANANIILGSESADLCLYKMWVYDFGFEWISAAQNFVSCLPDKASKDAAWKKIVDAMDDSYRVDYDKVAGRRNTMVIEMKDGAILPSLLYPAGGYCDFWINIVDKIPSELDADFTNLFNGSKIENQFIEGQGTTAMTYFRWNFRWKMDKKYNKRRITAKKNVASSMQDHKMGATRLYNDLHDACVGQNELGTRVAVFQYPVYGFLKELIEGTEDQYTYTFIGLYTIGPDKGDKPYFGFNDPRVESTIMHLEGTDHTPTGVGMEYPWDELRFDASKEAIGGILSSTSIEAAWEVGAAGELDPAEVGDQQGVQNMLNNEFKPAYKAAYDCSTFLEGVSESLSSINENPIVFRNSHSGKEVWTDGVYDLYYYNIQYKEYRSNGVNLLTQLGISASELSGKTIAQKNEIFKAKRRAKFVADMGKTWHKQDAIFHYVFCLMFAATDNFKKNTYPYKYYPLAQNGLWRWRQDDLDSILDINNQGFSAKSYSTLVGDVTATGSGSVFRGDNSVFWTLIKECFEDEIKAMVHLILDKMIEFAPSGQTKLERCVSYFKSLFWDKAQEYFGEGSYNVDAEWTYEEAWYQRTIGNYTNDVHPLQQSLGSHYEAEKDWVALRFAFLMSYYSYGAFSTDSGDDTSMGQISFRATGGKTYKITPALDFNPTILVGQSSMVSAEDRIKAGNTVDVVVPDMGSNDTHIYIQGTDYYSSIGDLADLTVSADNPVLTVSSKRLRSLKVGDVTASKVSSNVATLTIGACPSLETIDARNLASLRSAVNLTQCARLKEVLFGGTQSPNVMIPTGSKLHTLSLPSTITTLSLMKLRNLQNLSVDNFSSLAYLRLEENPNVDNFALLKQAYQESVGLDNVRVIGFDKEGDGTDVNMLADLAENCFGIDAEGNATSDTPVIEGTLTVQNAYQDSVETIQSLYPNLNLVVKEGFYINFEDPEVQRVLMDNGVGDSVGITTKQAEALTSIKTWFKGNTEIRFFNELVLFKNVKTFTASAFNGCTSLEKIDLSNFTELGDYTFLNCTSLSQDLYIPLVEEVGLNTFKNTAITALIAPKLTAVLNNCFAGCKSLKRVEAKKVQRLASGAFAECVMLESVDFEELVTIEYSVFENCKNLKTVNLSKVETLGSSVFQGSGLEGDYNLPNLIGTLYQNCFRGTKITSFIAPILPTTAYSVFKECVELKRVELLSVESTGEDLCYGCTSLETVKMPKLIHITNEAFRNCVSLNDLTLGDVEIVETGAFRDCSSLPGLYLGKVTSVGSYAFDGCTSFTVDVNAPNLTTLDTYAFRNTAITSFVAPILSAITSNALYGCKKLKFIELTDVTSIAANAFYGCSALEAVVIRNTTPPTLSSTNAFTSTNNCPFYVPDEAVEAYKAATNWKSYATRIKPLSEYEG